MQVVAAIPAFGLLTGCALGSVYPDLSPRFFACVLVVVVLLAVPAFRARREQWLGVAIVIAFASGGILIASQAWHDAWRSTLRIVWESIERDERAAADRQGHTVAVEEAAPLMLVGVLEADAGPTSGGGVSLDLDVRWAGRLGSSSGPDRAANPVRGRVLLTVLGDLAAMEAAEWRAGRSVRVVAQLRRPARYFNPGVPDQERALARRGISLVGTVKSAALVQVAAKGSGASEAAASVRLFARRSIASAVGRWSSRSAGIVTAIVIGDRTGLDSEVQNRLQEAGTYHVIAISGGNIAILAGAMLMLFRIAGRLGRTAMITAIAGLLTYGYFVGGGASVDRATLMAVVYLLGRTIDLRGPPLNILLLVAGLLTVSRPLAVLDPSFLLTFGATAAIVVVNSAVPLNGVRRWAVPAAGLLIASVAAEVALLPIGAALFSRVTFAGIVLNFAAIPLMAVAQLAGMILVPTFALAPLAASLIGWVAHLGAEGLVRSADLVTWVPLATWRVAPPSPVTIALYYGAGILTWFLARRRVTTTGSAEATLTRRTRQLSTMLALIAAVQVLWRPWSFGEPRDGRLSVTFLDVGQGDAALVRFPRGKTMVVDAGGLGGASAFDIGDRVVAPVLRQAGVRRLDTLLVTHGDADHLGGAMSLVREFHPWDLWEGVPVPRFAPLRLLAAEANTVGSRWTTVQSQDRTSIDGVVVTVKNPRVPDWERQRVRNDDSVVIELVWRDVSIVLTGDIGRDTEAAILDTFSPAPLRVLKVPHHGSATSSSEAFIRALAPTVAVISVGRSNNYGHPAPAVLARYVDAGTSVFRTDLDGAITIDTDGASLKIRTFTGRTRLKTQSSPHEGTKGTNH